MFNKQVQSVWCGACNHNLNKGVSNKMNHAIFILIATQQRTVG